MMRPNSYPEVQPADPADSSASALQAVQVALDRRDNGGDASSTGDEEAGQRRWSTALVKHSVTRHGPTSDVPTRHGPTSDVPTRHGR